MESIKDLLFTELFGPSAGRGEQKKLQIIEAAIDLLGKEGIINLTFEEVGKRVGIGKGNVRYHFGSLDDLLLSVAKYITFSAQQITITEVAKAGLPEDQLKAVVRGAFDWYKKNPNQLKVWLLFSYYSSIDPRFSNLHEAIRSKGRERILGILQNHPATKNRSKADLSDRAHNIQALITGAVIDLGVSPKGHEATQVQKRVIRSLETFCF